MSGPEKSLENFLARWSRRKLAAAEPAGDAIPKLENEQSSERETATATSPSAASAAAPAAFDPASLPPIESIDAASDLRAFLAPGVPMELTRAALRRAWVADPTIRDFIGIAENQWDFAKADGVPGFGSLDLASEDLRRIVSELCGDPADFRQEPDNAGKLLDRDAAPADPRKEVPGQTASQPVTPTSTTEDSPEQPVVIRHGRALPS